MKEDNIIEQNEDNEENENIGNLEEDENSKEIEIYEIEHNLKDETIYEKSIKVILLGDSMVGKSSIIRRICNENFQDSIQATISIEYYNYLVKVNNYIVRIQLWDTAGQEKYDSIIKNYFQSTDFAIYIYSIDDKKSFDRIKYWISNTIENNFNNDIKNILLGNKKDLSENGRKITYEEGENFAKENKFIVFKEISCKDKSQEEIDNILDVFDNIAKYYYKLSKQRSSTLESESFNYEASNTIIELSKNYTKKKKGKLKKKKKCC